MPSRRSCKLTEATNNPTRIPTNSDPADGSFRPSIDVAGFIFHSATWAFVYRDPSDESEEKLELRVGD
jgi:hypothetical protein